MAYRNHLLFNNIFLRRLAASSDDAVSARRFVYVNARDWYQAADFSTPARMALIWVAELLSQRLLVLNPDPAGGGHGWPGGCKSKRPRCLWCGN